MSAFFANPWGLLGLLGVPVVLVIHYLQRKSRDIPVSTLFLLDRTHPEARTGRRLDRLIPSAPLWLQLALILLLTAFLAGPSLPGTVRQLPVAVVIDDSASMRAFRDRIASGIARAIHGHPGRPFFTVLPSNPASPRLYAGESLGDLATVLESWEPIGGPPDPAPSLQLGRDRAGPHGLVLFLTDAAPLSPLPADALAVTVGRPLENVGIAGLRTGRDEGGPFWEALVTNPGPAPLTRTWRLEWDGGGRGDDTPVTVAAGSLATLRGPLPDQATRLRLLLSPDAFPLDDQHPFVRPSPKPLFLSSTLPDALTWVRDGLLRTDPALRPASGDAPPDLVLATTRAALPATVSGGIVLPTGGGPESPLVQEVTAAADHPLVDGLSWEALVVSEVDVQPPGDADTVLLWAGDRPLVSLAGTGGEGSRPPGLLVFHFNPALSNFERLPAGAVLFYRYLEEIRRHKPAPTRAAVEPGQPLASFLPPQVPQGLVKEVTDLEGGVIDRVAASTPVEVAAWRAPREPGFLTLREGEEQVWLEAGVAFADARESDFSSCSTNDATAPVHRKPAGSPAASAPGAAVLLIILALLLILYYFQRPRTARPGSPRPSLSPDAPRP